LVVDSFLPLQRDETVWQFVAPRHRVSLPEVAGHWLALVGGRLRRFLPPRMLDRLEWAAAPLRHPWGVDGWLGLVAVAGVGGALWFYPPSVGRLAAGFTLGATGAVAWLHFRVSERRARLTRDLPGMVDLLLLGLEGGMSLRAALEGAARHVDGPLGEELAEVERQVALGLAQARVLKGLAERLQIGELNALVTLLIQAESLGGGVTKAVSAIARRLRTSRVLAAERRAGEAPVKMLFPLVFCLFPSVLVLLLGPLLIGRGRLFNW
jgi:tight adherence protein C